LPSVGIPTLSVQNISKTIGINVGSWYDRWNI
jgi:hypothetical protein